jgi:hypothetical protein
MCNLFPFMDEKSLKETSLVVFKTSVLHAAQ